MKYGGVEAVKRRKVTLEGEKCAAENCPLETEEIQSEQNLSNELEARDTSVFDLDLLDCTICLEPLKSPVFQCQNGHVVCHCCLEKIENVCPSCQQPTGSIRCLVLEKLIESFKMKCKFVEFGCTARVKYPEKVVHERICVFEPVNCPFPDCNFRHERYSLFQAHVMQEHPANWRAYDTHSMDFIMLPTDRFHIGFGLNLCFVVYRQPGGTLEMGQVGHSVGHLCYPTVLKALSERSAIRPSLRYTMNISIQSTVVDGGSTFTLDAGCRINEREGSLMDGGAVVVPKFTHVRVELRFMLPFIRKCR